MDISDLYFGVMVHDFNADKMKTINLFNSQRVLRSVATYTTKPEFVETYFKHNKLMYLFGDTRGRCEWEFEVGGLFNDKTEKTDVFEMYVKPNEKLLLDMVSKVTKTSAKRWLKEHK